MASGGNNMTPRVRPSQKMSSARRMNTETERVMNETINTYQTIGSHTQFGNRGGNVQNSTHNLQQYSQAINQNPTNPQSLTSGNSGRVYQNIGSSVQNRSQARSVNRQGSRSILEGGKFSRSSTKRSIKLDSYKSKDVSSISRGKSQNYKKLNTTPVNLVGGSNRYYDKTNTVRHNRS